VDVLDVIIDQHSNLEIIYCRYNKRRHKNQYETNIIDYYTTVKTNLNTWLVVLTIWKTIADRA